MKGERVAMSSDEARQGAGVSRTTRRKTGPGRVILGWLVAYALVLAALALAGYEEAVPALWLPGGGLAGYGLGYLASRYPERLGETVANLFFFTALGVLMIMAVFIVASRPAEASDPWWLAIIGFVSGVLAATYVRLKRS
jgi:hypothetical protein